MTLSEGRKRWAEAVYRECWECLHWAIFIFRSETWILSLYMTGGIMRVSVFFFLYNFSVLFKDSIKNMFSFYNNKKQVLTKKIVKFCFTTFRASGLPSHLWPQVLEFAICFAGALKNGAALPSSASGKGDLQPAFPWSKYLSYQVWSIQCSRYIFDLVIVSNCYIGFVIFLSFVSGFASHIFIYLFF